MFNFHVAIVDEDPSYRRGLRTALQNSHGLTADLEAGSGHDALTLAENNRPDLFLISRQLPGLNGLQVGAAIRYHFPQSRIIILAMDASDAQCVAASNVGASAILPRFTEHEALRNTVRAVLHGEEPLQSWLGSQDLSLSQTQERTLQIDNLADPLTTRELAVFDCLLIGHSTKETASILRIADQTVKNRISSILHKLELESRMAAVRLALSNGWVEYGSAPASQPLPNDGSRLHPAATGASMVLRQRTGLVIPPTVLTSGPEHLSWD
jgi:DNA-binding NarL/FixJ family response regulator